MRVHPDIKYVDVMEGNPCVYLRTSTPELASSLIQSKHWPKMEIIQGKNIRWVFFVDNFAYLVFLLCPSSFVGDGLCGKLK